MIELFSSETPNTRKISIMLEEIGFDYKISKIDLSRGEQFKSEFKYIWVRSYTYISWRKKW